MSRARLNFTERELGVLAEALRAALAGELLRLSPSDLRGSSWSALTRSFRAQLRIILPAARQAG